MHQHLRKTCRWKWGREVIPVWTCLIILGCLEVWFTCMQALFFLHLWSFLPYYLFVKCFYKQKMWEGHCTLPTCVLACYVQITGRIIQSAYIASSYMCPGKKNQCQQIKGFTRYLILLQCYINKYCPPQKSKLLQEYFCRYYKMPPFFRVCFDG